MDFKNSDSLSERVKRLSAHFNITDPMDAPKKTALVEHRDKTKKSFIEAVGKFRAKQQAEKPIDPAKIKSIKDGSDIYEKGLVVGGTATTQNGFPLEPGIYKLRNGTLVTVGGLSNVISIEKQAK